MVPRRLRQQRNPRWVTVIAIDSDIDYETAEAIAHQWHKAARRGGVFIVTPGVSVTAVPTGPVRGPR